MIVTRAYSPGHAFVSIAFLWLSVGHTLFESNSVLQATPLSRFQGRALDSLASLYSGVDVHLSPNEADYLVGQNIVVSILTRTETLRANPFHSGEIPANIKLYWNDESLTCQAVLTDGFGIIPDTNTAFSGSFQLTENFWDESARLRDGFKYLLPGHYEGYFDLGILSNVFEFEVNPVPDTLTQDWTVFCRTRILIHDYPNRSPLPDNGSELIENIRHFLSLPIGTPWRTEVLMDAMNLYQNSRQHWTEDDSLRCAELIDALVLEPTAIPARVLAAAAFTIFKGGSIQESLTKAAAFADSLSDPRYREAALKTRTSLARQRSH